MKVNNWEDYLDEDDTDREFVKLTKKAKAINKRKDDVIRMKRKEKLERRAYQEKLNSYED